MIDLATEDAAPWAPRQLCFPWFDQQEDRRRSRHVEPRVVAMKVHLFGVDPEHRYGLAARRHPGFKHHRQCEPLELWHGLSGAVLAARLAMADSSTDTLKALVTIQKIAIEMTRRLLGAPEVHLVNVASDDYCGEPATSRARKGTRSGASSHVDSHPHRATHQPPGRSNRRKSVS